MLVTCFVGDDAPYPDAEIAKFVDRIWFDESGNANCTRSVIVRVAPPSPAPLRSLLMLLPCERDKVSEFIDVSHTLLESPDDYPFNGPKTHGFRIDQSSGVAGLINDDGIDNVVVRTDNRASITSVGPCAVLRIGFGQSILPGEARGFRVQFEVAKLAEEKISNVFSVELPYYEDFLTGRSFAEPISLTGGGGRRPEIPALPILDLERRGGFDIILYMPPGMRAQGFEGSEARVDDKEQDGTTGPHREKHIIHLRHRITAPRVLVGQGILVTGFFAPPVDQAISRVSAAVALLESRTDSVVSNLEKANLIAILSLVAGVAALIASVISLALYFA